MEPTAADGALQGLETLRSQTVEEARRALREAEGDFRSAEHARDAALAARNTDELALRAARGVFARAGSVVALRFAEAEVGAAQLRLGRAEQRVARTQLGLVRAEAERASRQTALRTAELARRAVARTVEQRAAAVSLRTERRLEDEVDDNFRAAKGVRTRHVSS